MRRVFPIALRRYVSSVTPNKIKEALSHSGIVSVPRWLNFNDSNKSLLDGYVRSNKVHGKFYRRIVQVLKEYVQEATPSIPPSSLISLRDCSKIDEAHRRADEPFINQQTHQSVLIAIAIARTSRRCSLSSSSALQYLGMSGKESRRQDFAPEIHFKIYLFWVQLLSSLSLD